MPTLEVGSKPEPLILNLATGGDFEATVTLKNKDTGVEVDWPVGTALSFVFADGTIWAATITGAEAAWVVDKATADLPAAGLGVKLLYVNGTTDRVLWLGKVARRG